jgi:hypothetical protein
MGARVLAMFIELSRHVLGLIVPPTCELVSVSVAVSRERRSISGSVAVLVIRQGMNSGSAVWIENPMMRVLIAVILGRTPVNAVYWMCHGRVAARIVATHAPSVALVTYPISELTVFTNVLEWKELSRVMGHLVVVPPLPLNSMTLNASLTV